MNAGPWKDRAEFETWWSANVIEFNRLAVDDPEEWERIACIIEAFQRSLPSDFVSKNTGLV